MQKILSIVWYKVIPPVFGGQKGIALFNQYLGEQSPLVCLCSVSNEPTDGLSYKLIRQLPVTKWQFINPANWKKIRTISKAEKATHLLLEHPYHAIGAYRAKKVTGARLILHAHNIESQRFRQAGKWWWWLLYLYEKWAHAKADLVLFKTVADRDYAMQHFQLPGDKCMIIPYGIEEKPQSDRHVAGQLIRQRHGIAPEEKILLFAATLDYPPNARAVAAIYSHIAPALAAQGFTGRIIVCGRNRQHSYKRLTQLSHPLVLMAGEVADIDNYFAAASVFINPVEAGGGVQTKIIDALGQHCNVVCFAHMADEQMKATAPDKLFLAPTGDWPAFIRQISQGLTAITNTPASFFACYAWKNSIARLKERMDTI